MRKSKTKPKRKIGTSISITTEIGLRDHFAAYAMNGLLTKETSADWITRCAEQLPGTKGGTLCDRLAVIAYATADALLAARQETSNDQA